MLFKLHDDLWLRLDDLNKIDAIIDDEINFILYRLYKKRISSNNINIDKQKDIDGYVDKLTNVMSEKMDLLQKIDDLINNTINEVKKQNKYDL